MQKDLSFVNHGFWCNGVHSLISMTEQTGENWVYITCGTKENTEKEFQKRQDWGFKVV